MSRRSFSRPSTATAAGASTASIAQEEAGTTNGSADDICPVCKTIRYLNKDMVFLVNPECYHPMCSNCVNRLFAGPNQCPYAGCHKTLRRKDFRQPFFGDLAVEREVDIRRRVAAVFNQSEDDFESLDAYNEHLEKVETLTMDLVSGPAAARRAAAAELARWEAEHRAEIDRNRRRGERADELGRAQIVAERDAARARRLDAKRQDDEERLARARAREADLDTLTRVPVGAVAVVAADSSDNPESGGDDSAAAARVGKVLLRRRGQHQRQDLLAAEEQALRGREGTPGLTIRGLKDKKKGPSTGSGAGSGSGAATGTAAADVGPYDPYAGLDPAPARFRVRAGTYRNPWLQGAREHTSHVVGGYDVHEYAARALFDTFSGLAVFVDDEKETGAPGTSAAAVATLGASLAAMGGADDGARLGAAKQQLPVKMEVDAAS